MNHSADNLEKKKETIVMLVSFFDMFDFPLTNFEVWNYVGIKIGLEELDELLLILKSNNKIDFDKGFYFLPKRGEIIKTRLQRYNYAERKFRRVFFVSQIFKLIPWVKLVAVGNLIGAANLRDKSDIDIFIVAEKNRLWLTRFFTTALMKLARMRPRPGDERDKICLSFYLSEDNLNLEKLFLNDSDLYFVYWLACLKPIYDRDATYKKLISQNNWLEKRLPNWRPRLGGARHEVRSFDCRLYKKILDAIFGRFELSIMKWQIKKLPEIIKKEMNKNTCVVVGENIIKLHTNDRRGEFLERFKVIKY